MYYIWRVLKNCSASFQWKVHSITGDRYWRPAQYMRKTQTRRSLLIQKVLYSDKRIKEFRIIKAIYKNWILLANRDTDSQIFNSYLNYGKVSYEFVFVSLAHILAPTRRSYGYYYSRRKIDNGLGTQFHYYQPFSLKISQYDNFVLWSMRIIALSRDCYTLNTTNVRWKSQVSIR